MTEEITNAEDTIDSRDVIERIEALKEEEELNEREQEELNALIVLDQDGKDALSDEWECGIDLIRDSYFKEFVEEFARDIGAISEKNTWPLDCIDWDQAAEQRKQDYTLLDFDGEEYWAR